MISQSTTCSGLKSPPSKSAGQRHHACLRGLKDRVKPDGIGCFAGDLPEAEQKVVWATQVVPVPDLFNQKVDGVAWRSKPSWYIVATEDRTVQPELHRFVAKRMGATVVELRSSHVPMLSQPHAVLGVIRNAARSLRNPRQRSLVQLEPRDRRRDTTFEMRRRDWDERTARKQRCCF